MTGMRTTPQRRFLCLSCGFIITGAAHKVPWFRIRRSCGLCQISDIARGKS
jgi:hypothetical protein